MMRQMQKQNEFFFDDYHEIWNKKMKKNIEFFCTIRSMKKIKIRNKNWIINEKISVELLKLLLIKTFIFWLN